jgi:leucine dehydrogenase
MWTYADTREAIRDALRLSRAMTSKSAVAGLPLGGGKGVIMLPEGSAAPEGDDRRAVLLDFADTVEMLDGAYLTAEDVGTSEPDMATIAEVTGHVTGLADGSGDPSPWTALGVEAAIRVACERVFGSTSLEGRRVAVVGVGSVGGRLAELLAEGGAELRVRAIADTVRAVLDHADAAGTTPLAAANEIAGRRVDEAASAAA